MSCLEAGQIITGRRIVHIDGGVLSFVLGGQHILASELKNGTIWSHIQVANEYFTAGMWHCSGLVFQYAALS